MNPKTTTDELLLKQTTLMKEGNFTAPVQEAAQLAGPLGDAGFRETALHEAPCTRDTFRFLDRLPVSSEGLSVVLESWVCRVFSPHYMLRE